MPNWTKEQLKAIETRGKNIIVSAGAGSGKTEVLSERVINNLINKYMHINEMLILTFTKNAAFEMKTRIKKKILMHEEIKEEALLIDSADITNFDSFTLALVKKYHYTLNLDSNLSIIDSSIINKLKIDFLNEIFEEEYQKNNETFENLILNFCNKNDKPIKEIIINLYNKIDLITNKEEYLKNYIKNYYNIENINNLFKIFENNLIKKINVIKLLLENLSTECDGNFYSKYYNALLPLINSKDYNEIKNNLDLPSFRISNATPLGKEYKNQITKLIKELKQNTLFTKELLLNNVENTQKYIEIIIDIITKLNNRIVEYKNENNSYEFNDISKFAIKIVKENTEIKKELKYHYKEIMIDEYQDTSDVQEEFINLIENNNVYMVGDIKQSIYRFRNANPNIFKDKYDSYKDGIKGIKLDLNKNFRSREEVLTSINDIFNHIMDNEIGNANYKEEHNLVFGNLSFINEGNIEYNNNLEIYNYEKNNINTQDEIEAFIIANDIKEKIKNEYKVFDKIVRPCKYSDFCILLDRGTTFELYKKIFNYLNIPLHIYQDEDILLETETYLINNIIGFIINIKNNIFDENTNFYYASIARSYLYEIKDNEIYLTIKNKKIKDSKIYQDLEPISKNIEYLSNEEILNEIIYKLNFYDKIILEGNVKEKTIIINNLLKKFQDLNKVGMDIYDINNYINSLIEQNDKIKIPASHEDIDSVTLTNIHKSKGLEYRICYFAGYNKNFSTQDIKSKVRFDNKYGIIFPDYTNTFIDTFISELNKNDFKINEISEKIRLLYVALTRCKEKMIIVSSLKEKEDYIFDNEIVDFITRSNYKNFSDILNSVYPYIRKYIKNIECPTINNDYKIPKKISYNINKDTKKITVKEKLFPNDIIEKTKFSKDSNKLFTKEEIKNIDYGKRIHYLLEITDFINPNYNNMTLEEINIIKSLLNQSIMKDIKNGQIFKEYEFIYEENNQTKNGIIDLMIKYDDHINIIDYKLKNTNDSSYIKQLKGYKKYIENLTNLPVNTYLYSLINNNIELIN